jgi:Flp pilus assembly pilin Flp
MKMELRVASCELREGRYEIREARGERRVKSFELQKLLSDETAATATEYVVAALAVALGAVAASAALAGVLVNYLHRIYLVVTLPIP